MWRRQLSGLLALAAAAVIQSPAFAAATTTGPHYVIAETTQVLLAPESGAKSTNVYRVRQKVDVLEIKGGWARVSKYYDGTPEGVSGQVARWVATKDLSVSRPADEKVGAKEPPVAAALVDSDDFARHRVAFIKAAQTLIDERTCNMQDFKDGGGWMKSTNHSGPVYFAYCGGMHKSNRLYLNAGTGKVFK
jgi:hypothetical protein